MKNHIILAAVAVLLGACDADVTVRPKEGDKTIINPPAKVEHNTTIVNPPDKKPPAP